MGRCTKKQKQWLWFIFLWLGGLGTVTLISFIIKLIVKFTSS
jgi:uncharacterized protein (DUF1810 family)